MNKPKITIEQITQPIKKNFSYGDFVTYEDDQTYILMFLKRVSENHFQGMMVSSCFYDEKRKYYDYGDIIIADYNGLIPFIGKITIDTTAK